MSYYIRYSWKTVQANVTNWPVWCFLKEWDEHKRLANVQRSSWPSHSCSNSHTNPNVLMPVKGMTSCAAWVFFCCLLMILVLIVIPSLLPLFGHTVLCDILLDFSSFFYIPVTSWPYQNYLLSCLNMQGVHLNALKCLYILFCFVITGCRFWPHRNAKNWTGMFWYFCFVSSSHVICSYQVFAHF